MDAGAAEVIKAAVVGFAAVGWRASCPSLRDRSQWR